MGLDLLAQVEGQVIALAAGLLTLALVAMVLGAARRRRKRRAAASPILVFPKRGSAGGRREPPVPGAAPRPVAPTASPQAPAPAAATTKQPSAGATPATQSRGWPSPREVPQPPAAPPPPRREVSPAPASAMDNGGSDSILGFEEPDEGTLQLLPGSIRLESGDGRGQEIRFVRVPGKPAEVTFGRATGPAHRHVQLKSPTVSRLHARMRFDDGTWILSNLSSTNPTRLNGRALSGEPAEEPVRDGDRIEMGEVAFLFSHPEVRDRLPFRSSWASETGLRSTNQDAVAVRKLPGRRELAVVCDGMGSHHAGGKASHTALEALVQALSSGEDLASAFHRANEAVRKAADADPRGRGMGTTMVALLREEHLYWLGNVGDSRAYRVDGRGIRQLTKDHSFVAEAVRAGDLSPDEAARSPWRNAITRNLGTEEDVEVDVFGAFSAEEPHVVVLCTDGLHGVLTEGEVERTVRETPEIRDVARALCDEAIRRGGRDNVTVAALAFGGGLAAEERAPRTR